MRVTVEVELPEELLEELDRLGRDRSEVLAEAVRYYLARREKYERDRRDVQIINRKADALNREAMDALDYQKPL